MCCTTGLHSARNYERDAALTYSEEPFFAESVKVLDGLFNGTAHGGGQRDRRQAGHGRLVAHRDGSTRAIYAWQMEINFACCLPAVLTHLVNVDLLLVSEGLLSPGKISAQVVHAVESAW